MKLHITSSEVVQVRINDIVPYERNARHNEKAIPVVAESIREFGLRGQIVLESRENPVIVAGHTRVAACKSLGWTEIPDENIAYCDGLTDEQIRAYRLADNRTGEVATWNKTLLQHEMRSIKKLDMSRFRFDFKSSKPGFVRGHEIVKTGEHMNMHLVNAEHCAGLNEMPVLLPVDAAPRDMTSFNFCKTAIEFDGIGVHFCIDDYQFERVWNRPEAYLDLLRRFDCVVCPDFSVYLDMPYPMKLWNLYRSRALGNWWQREGLTVVPNVTWSGLDSLDYCLEGIPRGGTIFISTVGVTQDREARAIVEVGIREALRRIEPSRLLLLGSDLGLDYGTLDVRRYKPKSFRGAK